MRVLTNVTSLMSPTIGAFLPYLAGLLLTHLLLPFAFEEILTVDDFLKLGLVGASFAFAYGVFGAGRSV
ncbi:MAG: hypothetical protein U0Y68_09945 [Blastocatellia bacterium]